MLVLRRFNPVEIITYFPKSDSDICQLAQCTAAVHADIVHRHLTNLNCSAQQKQHLLEQIVIKMKNSHTPSSPTRT